MSKLFEKNSQNDFLTDNLIVWNRLGLQTFLQNFLNKTRPNYSKKIHKTIFWPTIWLFKTDWFANILSADKPFLNKPFFKIS